LAVAAIVHWVVATESQPLHPANDEPAVAVAVSVTEVGSTKDAAHVAPQSMPAGAEKTEPAPVPVFAAVMANVIGAKVAVTDFATSSVTTQAPVPVHAPLQPVKTRPVDGVAVKVTGVPVMKFAPHVAPQSMPAGLEVTLPLPVPAFATNNRKMFGVALAAADGRPVPAAFVAVTVQA
jgi:hypothetical protein